MQEFYFSCIHAFLRDSFFSIKWQEALIFDICDFSFGDRIALMSWDCRESLNHKNEEHGEEEGEEESCAPKEDNDRIEVKNRQDNKSKGVPMIGYDGTKEKG